MPFQKYDEKNFLFMEVFQLTEKVLEYHPLSFFAISNVAIDLGDN